MTSVPKPPVARDFPRHPGYSPACVVDSLPGNGEVRGMELALLAGMSPELDVAPIDATASTQAPAVVLCAVDLGPSTGRVLFHAAGLARVLGAELRVVHVTADDSVDLKERVLAQCQAATPYEAAIDDDAVVIAHGRVSEAIQREALRVDAMLIVVGSRGHGGLARLLIGSTSEALLGLARTPVLLVPPTDIDIVSMGDHAALTCGPVLAAVDLSDGCDRQLPWASRVAGLAAQPLMLMTVARRKVDDHAAAKALRDRAHGLGPVKPRSLIVRRGGVAEEISRCAAAEHAGLVVIGLRPRPRGRPGAIASEVLAKGRSFVLAVPGC